MLAIYMGDFMSQAPNEHDLGGWEPEDLALTAQEFAGKGTDSGLPPDVRFQSNVAKLVQKRGSVLGADSDPELPAVFLLSTLKPEGVPREPMLDNGRIVVNGGVWLVSQTVNSGYEYRPEYETNDELFRFVTDSLGLGDVPAMIYDPRSSDEEIRFYPLGLNKLNQLEMLSIRRDEVTLEKIISVVDRVHEECLVTPDAQSRAGKLWKDSTKWWPSSEAEAIVQLNLKVGLVIKFLDCTKGVLAHLKTEFRGIP